VYERDQSGELKNELDVIESGASTSSATPHIIRARKSPKTIMGNFDEAIVRRTTHEVYIIDRQRPPLNKLI
jgi:hypothetical protein